MQVYKVYNGVGQGIKRKFLDRLELTRDTTVGGRHRRNFWLIIRISETFFVSKEKLSKKFLSIINFLDPLGDISL